MDLVIIIVLFVLWRQLNLCRRKRATVLRMHTRALRVARVIRVKAHQKRKLQDCLAYTCITLLLLDTAPFGLGLEVVYSGVPLYRII